MLLAAPDFARRVINRARVAKPSRVQALTGYAAETCREWCEACGFEPGETWAESKKE